MDIFGAKQEIKYQTHTVIVFAIAQLGIFGADIFIKSYQSAYNDIVYNTIHISQQFIVTSMYFVSSLIAIYAAYKEATELSTKHRQSSRKLSTTKTDRDVSVSSSTSKLGINGMLQVLSDNTGFKSFMQHLV